jgi:hypothetical protein
MNTTIKIYNGATVIGEYKLINHETATLVFDEVREASIKRGDLSQIKDSIDDITLEIHYNCVPTMEGKFIG